MGGKTRESARPRPEPDDSGTRTAPEPADEHKGTKPADAGQDTRPDPAEPATRKPSHLRRADRAGLVAAGALLAACGGLVLYGVLDTGQGDGAREHRTPAASVTYEVTGHGRADITYQARSTSGKAAVVKAAALPWRKTIDVPLGKEPIISIVLTEQGGQAHCALAVRGRHVQSATATGRFGRATCSATLPGPQATEG